VLCAMAGDEAVFIEPNCMLFPTAGLPTVAPPLGS
jgi:hypothetical protein